MRPTAKVSPAGARHVAYRSFPCGSGLDQVSFV
jgi:hypothetical protein